MKSILKHRRGQRLSPKDLKRFGHRLRADIEAVMPGASARIFPLDNINSEAQIVVPLLHRGRELGKIGVSFDGGQNPQGAEETLKPLVRLALENMWLRKALLTDGETGLYSRDHFKKCLMRAVRRHSGRGAAQPLRLNVESGPELMLVMAELRHIDQSEDAAQSLAAFSERLGARLSMKNPARLSTRRMCFLAEGKFEEVRQKIECALDDQLEAGPDSRPVAAWARYPRDLNPDEEAESTTRAGLGRRAAALMDKAATALFYARQFRGPSLALAYGDIIAHHGQVVQMLPLERVVVNLGRSVGAASGQVYMVEQPRREGEAVRYKGEITLLETADSYSVATITNRGTGQSIVSGDRLSFSRQKYEDDRAGERPLTGHSGFLDSLGDRSQFLAQLARWPEDQPLTVALARLDGFDKTLAMLGRQESERLIAFNFQKVAQTFEGAGATGRWQSEILALAWPEADPEDIKPKAHRLVSELMKSGPVSVGLVFAQPHRGRPAALMEDGLKALSEATFSGPGQVAVFGPLALNISGDRLFEGGDLSGALREYERGLNLAPGHLNLLNSLGVCHGRLGNFQAALETFQKIITLEPENMMAHYNLGYTHLLSGRMEAAEEALEKAAGLAPENFEAHFHLGKTALELGHLDIALPALKKAGELEGTRPVVYRLLGEALMLAHDNQAAHAAFKKAVKADPNDAYSLSALGALFVELANDLEVAKSLFQKSVEIDPTNSLYRQRLGRLLFAMGDFDGAGHHLNMAKEYGSRAPEVHYQLGCLAEEKGQADEAAEHFRAALGQDPAYKPALEKLAGN